MRYFHRSLVVGTYTLLASACTHDFDQPFSESNLAGSSGWDASHDVSTELGLEGAADASDAAKDNVVAPEASEGSVESSPDVLDAKQESVPPETTCFPGTKLCATEAGLECVIPDIYNGCGLEGCDPCNLPWAIPSCENEECVIDSCTDPLRAHCKGPQTNGCEAVLTTNENCGACGSACAPNHASGKCSGGLCLINQCDNGFADCDNNPANGCEVDLSTDKNHCSACNAPCGTTQKMKCENKTCVLDQCTTPGTGECDGNTTALCETNLNTDENNCGACKHQCSFPHAGSECTGGVCLRGACDAGWDDCDNNPDNGCEMDIHSNPSNCGGCGAACKTTNAVSSECEDGICKPYCKNGWGNCNGDVPGTSTANDGCETHIAVDVNHCGSCDAQPCSNSHGTNPTCTAGKCYLVCNTNWANCNGAQPGNSALNDGCEVNISLDPDNCGGCGNPCNSDHGTPVCTGGQCGISCSAPFLDCDKNAANGCEADPLTDVNNCGECYHACSSNHGTPHCNSGTCSVTCDAYWADCSQLQNDGCETNTSSSLANCGACGAACSTLHTVASCVNSHCTITACSDGFGNCDGDPNNGCETATLLDPAHCGPCSGASCIASCPGACSLPHATSNCSAGVCTIVQCAAPWADCDSAPGCETNTSTDPLHCSSCTTICSPMHATGSCNSGLCSHGACDSGWSDCDANVANGCETQTSNDPTHCGSCSPCSVGANPHGSPTCANSACGIVCDTGWGNCDTNLSNGCETNVMTSTSHCGVCGNQCKGGTPCIGGYCQD